MSSHVAAVCDSGVAETRWTSGLAFRAGGSVIASESSCFLLAQVRERFFLNLGFSKSRHEVLDFGLHHISNNGTTAMHCTTAQHFHEPSDRNCERLL